jgi:type II secretory pathway predicted ATPase ExeA
MLHRHGTHAEAVARIGWCVTERALDVITGEVGAGKTVTIRAALASQDASRHTIIYLGNPAVGGRGLYAGIVSALGGLPRFHKAALIPQTVDLLAAEDHERGRTVVLVLDEAHLLEELRLLTNAENGQPLPVRRPARRAAHATAADQTRHLRRPRPAHRAALRHDRHDPPGNRQLPQPPPETPGRSDTLFSDDPTALIHQVSRGLPRAVNNLTVQALVAAYATNKAIVDESSARAAVAEVTAE